MKERPKVIRKWPIALKLIKILKFEISAILLLKITCKRDYDGNRAKMRRGKSHSLALYALLGRNDCVRRTTIQAVRNSVYLAKFVSAC